MKMQLSNLKKHFGFHKKIVIFLVGLAIVGIVMGSFFTVILENADKILVKEYIQKFVKEIDQVHILRSFLNLSIENFCFTFVVWLFGISVVGIPIILFLYFSKAFVLGFSLSSFVLSYQAKGLLYSFFYIFPHQIINFVLYIILLNYATVLSLQLIQSFLYKKTIDFKVIMKKYCFIFGFVFLSLLVTSIYESVLVPKIFKFIFSLFS